MAVSIVGLEGSGLGSVVGLAVYSVVGLEGGLGGLAVDSVEGSEVGCAGGLEGGGGKSVCVDFRVSLPRHISTRVTRGLRTKNFSPVTVCAQIGCTHSNEAHYMHTRWCNTYL